MNTDKYKGLVEQSEREYLTQRRKDAKVQRSKPCLFFAPLRLCVKWIAQQKKHANAKSVTKQQACIGVYACSSVANNLYTNQGKQA